MMSYSGAKVRQVCQQPPKTGVFKLKFQVEWPWQALWWSHLMQPSILLPLEEVPLTYGLNKLGISPGPYSGEKNELYGSEWGETRTPGICNSSAPPNEPLHSQIWQLCVPWHCCSVRPGLYWRDCASAQHLVPLLKTVYFHIWFVQLLWVTM